MTYNLYTIYDRVTNVFGDVFVAANDDDAFRKVAYSMRQNPYIDDLALYHLGQYNVDEGCIIPVQKAVFLCNVSEIGANHE